MDSEKILFCYRNDEYKKPTVTETDNPMKAVAAIPCSRLFLKKKMPVGKKTIKKRIAECYENSGATYLWLAEELCDFLEIKRMELPKSLIEDWLVRIPFYHTLIFADDSLCRAIDYLEMKTDRLAALCIVCAEKYAADYEEVAIQLFQKEGIVLQTITYEMLGKNPEAVRKNLSIKGRPALLDFEDNRTFWDKRLPEGAVYYSFLNENRLFLDTFRKNGYNTLTK